jgi:hypothetical protein
VVRNGLLRQNEAFSRQRSTRGRDRGKEGNGTQHVRQVDVYGSLYSGFFPLDRPGKHPVEHDLKQLKHNDDRAGVFHHQVDSGDETR